MALHAKHALITGSSRGIGRGIALKLAQHGVHIAVHYYRQIESAQETLAQVRALGADGCVVQADVSCPAEISRMFQQVQDTFGSLDIFAAIPAPSLGTSSSHVSNMILVGGKQPFCLDAY